MTKDGRPSHYVFNPHPRFVKLVDDKERKNVLHIVMEDMPVAKRGLTQERIEGFKKLCCEEIDKAFLHYLNPTDQRDR